MKTIQNILPYLILLLLVSCKTDKSTEAKTEVLYQSDAFTLYKDKVVQGKNEATVLSPTHIKSNYKSPTSETFSRLIPFKLSINEKDNELPIGKDHWLIIEEEHESPLIKFGELSAPMPASPNTFLPVNYEYTFKVDMSPVIEQFEEKGYYEAYDGSKVAKADFKGFYIAGGAEPLTWDFVNLDNKNLKLQDTGKDNVYSITLKLNPYDEKDFAEKGWKLSLDLSKKPKYTSEQPIVDALFNLSLEEAIKNIEPDSTLRTGAKWGGVWTRDISYSIFLAFAYHEPEIAKISLLKKVKRDRIIQDTGSGGAWPVSSDRTTWALAAWEVYKITGEEAWLKKTFNIIKNTLEDDLKVLSSTESGLYRGESSFLDWREQTYPKWMSNTDIYVSENLGTNVVHFQAHQILAEMAKILGEPHAEYTQRAEKLKKAINESLWLKDKGFYAQFTYGRPYLTVSPRFEALGEALAVIFGVADAEKSKSIFEKSPLTAYGTTCIYPQIPNIPPYHNNGIWPFVQSYWNIAAAKAGNEKALTHGLAAIYRAGGLFLTNYENFVADSGDFLGTEINSDRMLWSMAGNLAMVHRVFMGMSFETKGIRFSPVIPKVYGGERTLSNFKYRKAVLDITVKGYGNQVKSILMDGKALADALFPSDLSGNHKIEITMNNASFDQDNINLVANHFSLPEPQTTQKGNTIEWQAIKGASEYLIYQDGKVVEKTKATTYKIPSSKTGVYKVSALDAQGWESFTSQPIWVTPEENKQTIEVEKFASKSSLPYSNYSGSGFVEISNAQNKTIEISLDIKKVGKYWVYFSYSNGSGPWNTENKCAIRSLTANEKYIGSLVFPQRGTDEWSDWGRSNAYLLDLKEGKNILKLSFEPWNINMNVEVNKAMLDCLHLVYME
jgi:hypothetical protein